MLCAGGARRVARVRAAAAEAGLAVERHVEVIGAQGKPALFSVFALRSPRDGLEATHPAAVETLCVRDRAGHHTPEYTQVLLDMGIPP